MRTNANLFAWTVRHFGEKLPALWKGIDDCSLIKINQKQFRAGLEGLERLRRDADQNEGVVWPERNLLGLAGSSQETDTELNSHTSFANLNSGQANQEVWSKRSGKKILLESLKNAKQEWTDKRSAALLSTHSFSAEMKTKTEDHVDHCKYRGQRIFW